MKLSMFSSIYIIFFADELLAQEKSLLENIGIIVGIVVGIATIAGVIIACLAYLLSRKQEEKTEFNIGCMNIILPFGESVSGKQLEELKAIIAGEAIAIGKPRTKYEKAGINITLRAGRYILGSSRKILKVGRYILKAGRYILKPSRDIIAHLNYLWRRKKKKEKQTIIVAGNSVATGESIIKYEEVGGDILKAGRDIIIGIIEQPKIEKEEAGRDIYQAGRDIIIQPSTEKVKLDFPLAPALNNQTAPEENFVGRDEILETITSWYKSEEVRIGALIGWGGGGKSALVRKWYDNLQANKIQPDGIFWWGFYRNAYLEQFLNALLWYVSDGQIELERIKSTWDKTERIKEYIGRGAYLIILDGLEQMQKGESGDEFGRMIHREFTELLHYLADLPKSNGLCLITTRYRLKDLDGWENRGYENRPLVDLSIPDALLMLKKRGVKGSDDAMKEVVKKYKGHALSLTSLAGYLNRYYGGDIKQAPDVEFVLGDKRRFKDVNKLLRKYAEKMPEAERRFMNIFSLFRRGVMKIDFNGVFRSKIEGVKLNHVLINMADIEFEHLISNLVDHRLISYDLATKSYSTHPLVKAYFESDFDEKNRKLCHKRIYQYIGGYAPERAETLEEMQPLFEQVYHGCAAGLYDEVYWNILQEKIYRGNERYLVNNLGAWETDLSLVRTFFPEGDLSQMPLVSKKRDQNWLLNEAGLALKNIGRPKEAGEPILTGVKMDIKVENWRNASVGYQNLADLQFRTGGIEAGLDSARKALDSAEKAASEQYIVFSKVYLGQILHLLGGTEEANNLFRRADELEEEISGYRLYGFTGVQYADFLVSMERIDEAFELTRQNLVICKSENWPDNISNCHRCLGAIERIKGNNEQAEGHIQDALEIARKVGRLDLQIEALLDTSRLHLDMGKYEDVIRDANQVLKICERTGFRFYEPGAEMVLAKAYLGQKDFEKAERFANSAYEKAVGMKYRWAEGDAADLLGEIYSVRGDKAKARKWLKKAVGCRKEILDPKVKETEGMLEGMG